MKSFTLLFDELDSTTSTLEKVAALKRYFQLATTDDSLWAVLLLTQKISKRVITSATLKKIFLTATQYPEWLLAESYEQVGDTAETVALLLRSMSLTRADTEEPESECSLTEWLTNRIPQLANFKSMEEQGDVLLSWWKDLSADEIFILNKLMTGGFRVGVSEKLVIRALSELFEVPSDRVAHRLTGVKNVNDITFADLISKEEITTASNQPYPFCLAHPWASRVDHDWSADDWCVEWKYDGIRSQIIARDGQLWIWSRGEQDISGTFPDLLKLFEPLQKLNQGTVIDGEVLIIREGHVESFQELQKRLGRKKPSLAIMKENPVGFVAYDCLEFEGQDLRERPLSERRQYLKRTLKGFSNPQIKISEVHTVKNQDELEKLRSQSRENSAEGLMIKHWHSPYSVGRKTGSWWKHKMDPLTLDAVLIYAQAGTGRRANLYTDYTFALWTEDKEGNKTLVPFAKAYSGLDQSEIDELDKWIRRHTREKFGPVRSLEAAQVFEIGFEGVLRSSRHKSGLAVRFPRILRWRHDKKPEDADSLETAEALL